MQNQSQLLDVESIEFNPWIEIWFRPRKTIRRIVDSNPKRWVILLAALAGVANVLDQASARSWGDSLGLPGILAMAVVLGPLLGLAGLAIGGWWYRWTGSWFGGQANTDQVRAAIA